MAGLFNWRRRTPGPPADAVRPPDGTGERAPSRVLPRLLAGLGRVDAPVLLDLGPVVGSNVAFFGEQLGARIVVEDLFDVVETHARAGTRSQLGDALLARLPPEPTDVDAILCWDLFDYLEPPVALRLSTHLVSRLRPGGWLYGFFGVRSGTLSHYTRYIVEDVGGYRLRTVPATPMTHQALVTRDVDKLFGGLSTIESVLLKSRSREMLFRKRP